MEVYAFWNEKVSFLIAQIKQVGDRALERIILKKNIDISNGAQGRILHILWKRDGIPIKELSKQTGPAMSSLTTILDHMETAGLIHRQHGDKDRRKVLIFLRKPHGRWNWTLNS